MKGTLMRNTIFKITLRNLRRYKGYSFINIAGLAMGIACCILIFIWVQDELSYESQHHKAERIYQINKKYEVGDKTDYNPSTPYPLADAVSAHFAETEYAVRLVNSNTLIRHDNRLFYERVCFADTSIFRLLTYHFLKGDPLTALSHPNSMVLTDEMSRKYFGEENPMGQKLLVNNRDELTITGVVENIRPNTEFRHTMFAPLSYKISGKNTDTWHDHWFQTFVLLKENTDVSAYEAKLTSLIREKLPDEKSLELRLQSLKDRHLYSVSGEPVRMKYVYFFSLIAGIVLVIAGINYTNLSTARASRRAKEVGIRKVAGAGRRQLLTQFFSESAIHAAIALILALVIVWLFMPAFNSLTEKTLILDFSDVSIIAFLLFTAGTVSLIAGSYPAVLLSSMIPVKVLKGNPSLGAKGSRFRRALVIAQFSLSVMVIVGAVVIHSQLSYMRSRNMGINTENLVYLRMNNDVSAKYDVFKNRLLKQPGIQSVTRVSELPTETWSLMRGITWPGKTSEGGTAFAFASVDHDYVKTLKLKIYAGRDFSKEYTSDSAGILINRKAAEVMNILDPLGKTIRSGDEALGTVIGVTEDFNFLPMTYEMEPMVMLIRPEYYGYILVKISGENIQESVNTLSAVWKETAPHFPFEYHFVDERFEKLYNDDIRAGMLFGYFVILALILSCLGLFGLASFMAEQRTKEIGIRKILGSSVSSIIFLTTKEFVGWVLIANLIAWPFAYFAMQKWLQDFAYRVDVGIGIFVLTGIVTLVIAFATVGYQAVKSATANPVDSLRYE